MKKELAIFSNSVSVFFSRLFEL